MKLSIKKALSLTLACVMALTSVGAADFASAAKLKKNGNVPTAKLTIQADADKPVTGSAVVTGVAVSKKRTLSCTYSAVLANSISTASAVATSGDSVTVQVVAVKNAAPVTDAAIAVVDEGKRIASVLVTVVGVPEKAVVKKTKVLSIQDKVVIAPGKTKNVKYVAKKTAAADKIQAVKFKSSNKNVVTAKKVAGKKQVALTVPSTAKRGASANVTLTSGKKKATIKVLVQNKAKKAKAVKKYITVSKGKKVNVKVNVTAQNKNKAVTDAIKTTVAKTKIAKVTKKVAKKGKVIVTIKGKKKGSSKVTVKVGSRKVTLDVRVK